MPRTRVGFVGAGAVARRHERVLGGFPDVELIGVTDVDSEAADAMSRSAGAHAYPTLDALLSEGAPDAVYVCVPPFAHGAPEQTLIAAGVPFFVEKPLAVDLATAAKIAGGVAASGLVTATGYHWRYLEGMARARELHNAQPVRLVIGAWLDKVPPPAWWIRREQSGGQVVEQATHLLDCMLDIAGDVDSVSALGRQDFRREFPHADVDTSAVAVLSFGGGALGTLAATSLLRSKARASVEFIGEGWRVEVAEAHYVLDDGDGSVQRADPGDAKRLVDRAFIDAVQGRPGAVRAPYDVALMTHRVGCAIARSQMQGTKVEIDAT